MPGDLADRLATVAQESQDLSARRISNCAEHRITLLASYGNHLVTDTVTKWLRYVQGLVRGKRIGEIA
jgi:hypothetical protein